MINSSGVCCDPYSLEELCPVRQEKAWQNEFLPGGNLDYGTGAAQDHANIRMIEIGFLR